ncbi:MAG: NrdH-redoxin [Chloroflexi bacterium]|nr:MAG: NrdH-redoxin [Chloroflexota bacterium]
MLGRPSSKIENCKDDVVEMNSEQIVMYTTQWCGDCHRAKQVMKSLQVPYKEIDISHDPEAAELVVQLNRGNRSVPTIVFPDGSVLTEPKTATLVQKLQAYS